ncbi:50S ribosomal protein L29 [Verrucomicrobia bacterium S94]|uniref:Large ribosomal subunit protein uL29 n=1 Tax=Pontiella agarivorans TaxID=3038953 RepID=A0ABU5MZN7_9BACT|nr:50S ribosomal protein L29 [Pontiella agarivorans]MDZ8119629.1 50S ribosomal protein L29 [Pontiella agarivorans]QBG47780.1 50S ribosomal protein L29 [Verrucomicrobia bacterium S94]
MKVNEIKEMTVAELDAQLEEIKKEQFNLKLQQVSGQLENPARMKELRRTVARIKTIQNQKKVEG